MIKALIIFALMYVGMLALSEYRVAFALGAAALMVIFGVLSPMDVSGTINWNVIMMIGGTMGIVTLFIETGMPARLADLILMKAPNACWAIISLALFAGFISAFVDNIPYVAAMLPVVQGIAVKLGINPAVPISSK